MTIMKMDLILLSLALASLSAFAADVTGTWNAEFETQRGLQKYTFNLKQDGGKVAGKASVERDGEKDLSVDGHGGFRVVLQRENERALFTAGDFGQ